MNAKEDQESFAMKANQWKIVPHKNLDANNKECKSLVSQEAGKTKNEINTNVKGKGENFWLSIAASWQKHSLNLSLPPLNLSSKQKMPPTTTLPIQNLTW